jgi:predicted ATPase
VYQLRRALRLDSLHTHRSGYRLEVKDSAVDALRFERVVHEVSHVDDASPRWQSLRLGEALTWWRGPALADFDATWARSEAARLDELRLSANEELMDARLALGEHAVLVPELEAAVSEHPLRERLWRQLILALYRSDRQTDALRAYQRVRTTLADELGLEPSPELTALERAILAHDESLIVPAPAAGSVIAGEAREQVPSEPGVSLPSPPTSFVGRDADVETIRSLLDGHRIVTLTGPGGCGKTRLAIEVAGGMGDDYPDGARFADLAAVTDGAQVGDAVVAALGLARDPARADPITRLAAYLSTRAVLCVLDNCEQVRDACASLAEAVATHGGPSRLLATSREPLGVVGEQVYAVPSLDVDGEAMALFAERAAEARAGFVVHDANRATVGEICRHLDGIPLAIELAAARISHLSPTQLLERLDDRFGLLASQRRAPRHQTLTATLDWSCDLLDADERWALRCLGVFPASFSLEAAEAVIGTGNSFETLASLVSKSLVHIVDTGERLRYRLLETVRLYAWDHLAASEAETVRTRHRDWILDWVESFSRAERMLGDTDPLAGEHANIHAALDYSHAQGDTDAVLRTTACVDWRQDEHWREGTRWLHMAADGEPTSSDLAAAIYVMLGRLGYLTAQDPADWARIGGWAQRAIDVAGTDPTPMHAEALGHLAIATAVASAREADESLARPSTEFADRSVAVSQHLETPWRMYSRLLAGTACSTLSLVWPHHAEAAQHHCSSGITLASPHPPFLGLHAELCVQLAVHCLRAGDTAGACKLARQAQDNIALTRYGRFEAPLTLALILAIGSENGDTAALEGELHAFHRAAQRRDWGPGAQGTVMLFGGFLAALRGDWELACRLLAAGEHGIYGSILTAHMYVHFLDLAHAALDADTASTADTEGRAMLTNDAICAALSQAPPQV